MILNDPGPLPRERLIAQLATQPAWDLIVIGGGATGLGTALDAATRGYRTLLLEARDFAKGTSSRSTKLVHGGVRYLAQGRIGLVREALLERWRLSRNAPGLVRRQRFVVPVYRLWDKLKLGAGLTAYDLLAGRHGFGRARLLDAAQTLAALPTVRKEGLKGGIAYFDGQFDDSALAVALARSTIAAGGLVINYMAVTGLRHESGRVCGVIARDQEGGEEFVLEARAVVNATGVWADDLRKMDEPGCAPMLSPSQGVHLVVGPQWLPGGDALLVPETTDGRVLFMIPWQGKVLLGTTDTPRPDVPLEPGPLPGEVEFILRTAQTCLSRAPQRSDVLSVFAGLRPLIGAAPDEPTGQLSREHVIRVSASGLLTIGGGKWTTYRRMAEETTDRAANLAGLSPRPCVTAELKLLDQPLSDGNAGFLHPRLDLSAARVEQAIRFEFARNVEDVLARRHRALFLDAEAAVEVAPAVTELMAGLLGRDGAWVRAQTDGFRELASAYHVASSD